MTIHLPLVWRWRMTEDIHLLPTQLHGMEFDEAMGKLWQKNVCVMFYILQQYYRYVLVLKFSIQALWTVIFKDWSLYEFGIYCYWHMHISLSFHKWINVEPSCNIWTKRWKLAASTLFMWSWYVTNIQSSKERIVLLSYWVHKVSFLGSFITLCQWLRLYSVNRYDSEHILGKNMEWNRHGKIEGLSQYLTGRTEQNHGKPMLEQQMTWLRIEVVVCQKQSRLSRWISNKLPLIQHKAMKTYMVYAVKATCILNLSLEWKWGMSIT